MGAWAPGTPWFALPGPDQRTGLPVGIAPGPLVHCVHPPPAAHGPECPASLGSLGAAARLAGEESLPHRALRLLLQSFGGLWTLCPDMCTWPHQVPGSSPASDGTRVPPWPSLSRSGKLSPRFFCSRRGGPGGGHQPRAGGRARRSGSGCRAVRSVSLVLARRSFQRAAGSGSDRGLARVPGVVIHLSSKPQGKRLYVPCYQKPLSEESLG